MARVLLSFEFWNLETESPQKIQIYALCKLGTMQVLCHALGGGRGVNKLLTIYYGPGGGGGGPRNITIKLANISVSLNFRAVKDVQLADLAAGKYG